MDLRNRFLASVGGTFLVALCCFTPILALTLSSVGLAALVGYLDMVLIPALAVMAVVTWSAYRRYAQSIRNSTTSAS